MLKKNILINFPSNSGDTILALPALDMLRASYRQSVITALASSKTAELLLRNNFINEVLVFDKLWSAFKKFNFSLSLRGRFDLVIDFKNSFLPIFIGGKHTPFVRILPRMLHAKDVYVHLITRFIKIESVLNPALPIAKDNFESRKSGVKSDFVLNEEEINKWKASSLTPSLFIACSSRSSLKQYPYTYLQQVVETLAKHNRIVILGEEGDLKFYKDILAIRGIINLVGKTKLYEVHYLLKHYCRLLLCVDSSILHLGSYLNIPVVSLFGPTDVTRYGPWSRRFIVLHNEVRCAPCKKPVCRYNYDCMEIAPQRVIEAVHRLLGSKQ